MMLNEKEITTKMDKMAIQILPILQTENKSIGMSVLISLIVRNIRCQKHEFLELVSQAWDAFIDE
jgi:hypothetical protein